MRILASFAFIVVLGLISCQEEKDNCEDINCLNGGTCIDGICDCPPGYNGINCQDFNECDTVLCLNGGICVSGLCDCPPGFSGISCEEFDPCFDVICQNGGECIEGICQCETGFEGPFCENQITPELISITGIQITLFPLLNEGGDPWDAASLPDIYPVIAKNGETIYSAPNSAMNATLGGIYVWAPSISVDLTDVLSSFTFTLRDEDESGQFQEMESLNFIPYSEENDFPSVLEFSSDSLSFKLQVDYTW